jgi:hypothetical protein
VTLPIGSVAVSFSPAGSAVTPSFVLSYGHYPLGTVCSALAVSGNESPPLQAATGL